MSRLCHKPHEFGYPQIPHRLDCLSSAVAAVLVRSLEAWSSLNMKWLHFAVDFVPVEMVDPNRIWAFPYLVLLVPSLNVAFAHWVLSKKLDGWTLAMGCNFLMALHLASVDVVVDFASLPFVEAATKL
jgi:hypothetical protein